MLIGPLGLLHTCTSLAAQSYVTLCYAQKWQTGTVSTTEDGSAESRNTVVQHIVVIDTLDTSNFASVNIAHSF